MTLRSELAEAEASVATIKQRIASEGCAVAGHDWKHDGGANAGCELDTACFCSVPVHTCTVCGDSDYGENLEARNTIANCEARNEEVKRLALIDEGCTCQHWPTHCANDCALHGLEDDPSSIVEGN